MKRLFPVLLIAAAAFSCSRGLSTEVYSDNITMPAAESGADSLFMTISLEYVKGGLPDAAGKEINRGIISRAFDLYDAPESIEDAASAYRENLIDEYLTEYSHGNPVTWEDNLEGSFSGKYRSWLTYSLSYYSYKGGAHGLQTVSPIVFDSGTGAIIGEDDIFTPGYQDAVAGLLRKSIAGSMSSEDPELESLVAMESVMPNNNFSVGAGGVTWYFQPYEIGPYALGVVSATIPWNELEPYLK
ncbi:MAG: DUF3298 domain-containing protein [Bacteroidales bacterium]|nr:DUF3298 domain-containing protein [Bacteroidales bacterium]